MRRVWITGRVWSNGRGVSGWEVLGVCSRRDLAVDRCERENDFVAPLLVDEDLPDQQSEWPGASYPLAEERS